MTKQSSEQASSRMSFGQIAARRARHNAVRERLYESLSSLPPLDR
jgi:hypothetical protein